MQIITIAIVELELVYDPHLLYTYAKQMCSPSLLAPLSSFLSPVLPASRGCPSPSPAPPGPLQGRAKKNDKIKAPGEAAKICCGCGWIGQEDQIFFHSLVSLHGRPAMEEKKATRAYSRLSLCNLDVQETQHAQERIIRLAIGLSMLRVEVSWDVLDFPFGPS